MEEPQNHHQHHHHHHRRSGSSRLGLKSAGGGEIVEVQGGHIVRSTGRKDRHSKVCTAKGTRDRRVRLAAHTAIQFYDVQDRLGYDRPSKAVDWLIEKAKAAIDELEELPAWNPITNSLQNERPHQHELHEHHQQQLHNNNNNNNNMMVDVNENLELDEKRHQHHHHDEHVHNNNMVVGGHVESSSFLPPSMDSDAIADTIKSFFPVGGGSSGTTSSVMEFQSQDLRLSLQSFQDPVHLHHHQPPPRNQTPANQTEQTLLGFDTNSSWSDHHQAEIARFQRMVAWNSGGGGGGFIFDSPPPQPPPPQPLLGQTQFFSQRGPLQSSNTPSVRAWIDPYSSTNHHHQSSVSGGGFASGGGFSGFRIPARIQGEDEEHDGISDKPSSASSDSRH